MVVAHGLGVPVGDVEVHDVAVTVQEAVAAEHQRHVGAVVA